MLPPWLPEPPDTRPGPPRLHVGLFPRPGGFAAPTVCSSQAPGRVGQSGAGAGGSRLFPGTSGGVPAPGRSASAPPGCCSSPARRCLCALAPSLPAGAPGTETRWSRGRRHPLVRSGGAACTARSRTGPARGVKQGEGERWPLASAGPPPPNSSRRPSVATSGQDWSRHLLWRRGTRHASGPHLGDPRLAAPYASPSQHRQRLGRDIARCGFSLVFVARRHSRSPRTSVA